MKKIIILLGIFFVVLLAAAFVNSASCCLTTGTESCINSDNDAAITGCQSFVSESCSERDECQRGACVDNELNSCESGKSRIDCSGEFQAGAECGENSQFAEVCCSFSDSGFGGYSFIPSSECENRGGTSDPLLTEQDCRNRNRDPNTVRGCCVNSDESCTYELLDSCEGYNQGELFCRQLTAQCNPVCEGHSYIAPGPEKFEMQYDLYWYDSCDQLDSLTPADECNDLTEMPTKDENDNWICGDAKCNDVWDNPYTDENYDKDLINDNTFSFAGESRDYRYNGESWCEYQQAKVGPALDLPGSSHYRHSCIDGLEVVDSGDVEGGYRDKVCIEEVQDVDGIKFTKARWLFNNEDTAKDCLECNDKSSYSTNEEVRACCRAEYLSDKACAYVGRKSLEEENVSQIFVDREIYNVIIDMYDGSADADLVIGFLSTGGPLGSLIGGVSSDTIDVERLQFEYRSEGQAPIIIGFNQAITRQPNPDIDCQENGQCYLELNHVPEGRYDLLIFGRFNWCAIQACVPLVGCECIYDVTREHEWFIVVSSFNSRRGVCTSLVPPATLRNSKNINEKCNSAFVDQNFDLITFQDPERKELELYPVLGRYYNFPYHSFLQSGELCEDTQACSVKLQNLEYNSTLAANIAIEDINNLCKSLGDCGGGNNIGGKATTEGLVTSGPCVVLNSGHTDCSSSVDEMSFLFESNKYENLKSGEPTRPNEFLPLGLILFPSLKFLKRRRILLICLFALVLILAACGDSGSTTPQPPTPLNAECNSWQSPVGGEECWRCSSNEDELRDEKKGLLPVNEILNLDGKPSYQCTEYMCRSLGANCEFVPGLQGEDDAPKCVEAAEDTAVPKVIFLSATYTCNSFEQSNCIEDVPVINEETLSIAGKVRPLEAVEIKFKTVDENPPRDNPVEREIVTFCKVSESIDMANELNLPFPDGPDTNHILRIANPTEGAHKYYLKCYSTRNPERTINAPYPSVEFTVGRSGFTTPVISDSYPRDGDAYVKHGGTTKVVRLFAEGDILNCRWDNRKVPYGQMGVVETTTSGSFVFPNGTRIDTTSVDTTSLHNFICDTNNQGFSDSNVCETLIDNVVQGENRYWFSCMGLNNQASEIWPANDAGYLVVGTDQLNITNIKCMHSLGEDCGTIYDRSFDFSIETVGGAQSGSAGCKWKIGDYTYDSFDEPGGNAWGSNFATFHAERNFTSTTGQRTLRFICEDVAENIAESEVNINLEADSTQPRIIKVYRTSNELNVDTDEITDCKYITNLTASFENAISFSGDSTGVKHSVALEVDNFNIYKNFYRVRCTDRFGNSKQTDVYVA